MVDKAFCMSSYLMYRYVFNPDKSFLEGKPCSIVDISFPRKPVKTAEDLLAVLEQCVRENCRDGRAALALSGGIDSAILAKFCPTGTKAYTFRCIVPGTKVTDETEQATRWAEVCGLDHEIIDIHWEDVEAVCDDLMRHKGAPVH